MNIGYKATVALRILLCVIGVIFVVSGGAIAVDREHAESNAVIFMVLGVPVVGLFVLLLSGGRFARLKQFAAFVFRATPVICLVLWFGVVALALLGRFFATPHSDEVFHPRIASARQVAGTAFLCAVVISFIPAFYTIGRWILSPPASAPKPAPQDCEL